jgi:hypothetical protein
VTPSALSVEIYFAQELEAALDQQDCKVRSTEQQKRPCVGADDGVIHDLPLQFQRQGRQRKDQQSKQPKAHLLLPADS